MHPAPLLIQAIPSQLIANTTNHSKEIDSSERKVDRFSHRQSTQRLIISIKEMIKNIVAQTK